MRELWTLNIHRTLPKILMKLHSRPMKNKKTDDASS